MSLDERIVSSPVHGPKVVKDHNRFGYLLSDSFTALGVYTFTTSDFLHPLNSISHLTFFR